VLEGDGAAQGEPLARRHLDFQADDFADLRLPERVQVAPAEAEVADARRVAARAALPADFERDGLSLLFSSLVHHDLGNLFDSVSGGRGGQRGGERAEDAAPVRRAEQVFAGALRVRHQAEHVALAVADARDVVARAVRVRFFRRLAALVAVAEDDAVLALQLFERRVVADVVALAVRDGDAEHAPRLQPVGERRFGRLDADADVVADVVQVAVAYQRAGQKPRLAENLEAVADAEHQAAARGHLLDRRHDGREARQGTRAQVVAVGEAAGDDDRVVGTEVRVAVPDEVDGLADVLGDDVVSVVIAV